MPNGSLGNPSFQVRWHENGQLRARGCNPFTYSAAIGLRLAVDQGRVLIGRNLPFRLDTEAFISALPERWLLTPPLRRFVRTLSDPLPFVTTAGSGQARVARGVLVRFPGDPRDLTLDFLVMPGLNSRQYGLISLRDVMNHFALETVGALRRKPDGEPIELPRLLLHPRDPS